MENHMCVTVYNIKLSPIKRLQYFRNLLFGAQMCKLDAISKI